MEVHSAHGNEDICKMKLYQLEQRANNVNKGDTVKQDAHKRDESWHMNPRAVSVIDYQEYRKLEEKQNRILLKRELYDRKKVNDEN